MIKKLIIKSFVIIIGFILMFSFSIPVFASKMIFDPSTKEVGLNEQFYVDLMLDPEDVSINGIEGNITFPSEYLSFVRAEEAKSMVSLWVQSPTLVNNTVKFIGIIPNGFDGVIDPFNQSKKLPGLIVRFVFEAIKPGSIEITTPPFLISLNDGLGTTRGISSTKINIKIGDTKNEVIYENNNGIPPELEASVIKDPNIFNNKFSLIFKAIDRNSGIKEVLIKEGSKEWKKIESPYLLEDQTRRSIIVLQAINYSGGSIVVKIDPVPYKFNFADYVSLFILIVVLFFVFKKINDNKNKK